MNPGRSSWLEPARSGATSARHLCATGVETGVAFFGPPKL